MIEARPWWQTTIACVVVFVAVILALTLVDRYLFRGPEVRDAIESSARNGANICEFNRAMADAFAKSASQNPELTPEVRDAIDHLVEVAEQCVAPDPQLVPTTTQEDP